MSKFQTFCLPQFSIPFFVKKYDLIMIPQKRVPRNVIMTIPVEYHCSDLVTLLIFATLLSASIAAALLLLQRLFQVLSVCASPFCADFVLKLRAFGYSLLPITVFSSVGETLAVRFLSAGKNTGVFVQWGVLIAFAVTMCLVVVFRYGVQLQKESDETL